jgi:hypothetical protein
VGHPGEFVCIAGAFAFADYRLSLEVGHAPEKQQDKGDRDNNGPDSPDAHATIMSQAGCWR